VLHKGLKSGLGQLLVTYLCAGHAAHLREMTKAYILIESVKRRDPLEVADVEGMIILKRVFKKWGVRL
jgi:hypothetical protein